MNFRVFNTILCVLVLIIIAHWLTSQLRNPSAPQILRPSISPSVVSIPSPSPFPPNPNLTDALKEQLGRKYAKTPDDILIEVSSEIANHAVGVMTFAQGFGGGIWFAAKEKGGWVLIYDGQSAMSCTLANQYLFPEEMVPACFDEATMQNIKR